MDDVNNVEQLTREIAQRETELARLKARLTACGAEAQREREQGLGLVHEQQQQEEAWKWPLAEHEYERYGRQMIVPKFGRDGELSKRRLCVDE